MRFTCEFKSTSDGRVQIHELFLVPPNFTGFLYFVPNILSGILPSQCVEYFQFRSFLYGPFFLHSGKRSSNLRVTSSKPRVTSSNLRVTSSNPRLISLNLRVTSTISQVTTSNPPTASSNTKVQESLNQWKLK